ncbi:MAG TPA: hypothetical protein VG737_12875 [Cyclobacteriaceae bacterium]|nr:hypothetical protein [Cyclobacteriaceae bacterium]
MRKIIQIILVLAFGNSFCQESDIIKTARVIGAMHAQYQKVWYPNVTFVQRAIFYKDGKVEKEETWYEAVSGANGLVIKLNDINGGNGVMYSGDSQYVWRDNKLVTRTKRLNDLFVLGFSVYTDNPSVTIDKLKGAGYDFNHIETFERGDTTEYIIGDPNGPRFWIDREHWLFTRLQKKDAEGHTIEMQFNNYQPLGGGWIAEEVVFLKDGEVTFREIYRDIKIEKKLPFHFIPPKDFSKLKW